MSGKLLHRFAKHIVINAYICTRPLERVLDLGDVVLRGFFCGLFVPTLVIMIGDLVKIQPSIAVLIVLHIVCTLCLGVLLILAYDSSLFFELDPFRLVLLSISLTAPVTAVHLLICAYARIPKGGDIRSVSVYAVIFTLITLVPVILVHLCVEGWTIIHSVWLVYGIIAFSVLMARVKKKMSPAEIKEEQKKPEPERAQA